MTPRNDAQHLTMVCMLAAGGLILFVFESFLPLPMPAFRPGLGNIATILALLYFGPGDALKVTLLRIVLGSLLLGRLFTPLFVFAMAGGLASFAVMALLWRYGRVFGPVGFSAAGAVVHNAAQLGVALLFIPSVGLVYLFPPLLLAGVITGTATGFIAAAVYAGTAHRLTAAHPRAKTVHPLPAAYTEEAAELLRRGLG